MAFPKQSLAKRGTGGRDAQGVLRRLLERRVVQWALTYLGGAWLVVQVFDALSPSFGWRPVVGRVIVALLAAGLLVTLVVAWYHGEQGRRRVSGLEMLMLGVLFVIGGSLVELASRDRAAPAAAPGSSLAPPPRPPAAGRSLVVLPFANLSGSRENEYFSDGVAEDILAHLSRIGGLRVISRTSAMAYRGSNKTLRQIAGELGVSHVVEGSVRRAGNHVRISVQLVDARTDAHLWAESYDRELKDVFQVQSDIAQQIAGALQIRLTQSERDRITAAPTTSLTAYDYYLQGRQYYLRFTESDLNRAIALFEHAILLDPNYALAYAWLARARISLTPFRNDSADVLSRRAIALDPDLSDGYAALAEVNRLQGRFSAALEHYRRAVALNPNDATATVELGQTYGHMGRLDESLPWLKYGIGLDPRTVWPYSAVCATYIFLEMLDEAERWCRRGLELEPDFAWLHSELANLYHRRGNLAKAREHTTNLRELDSIHTGVARLDLWQGNLAAALPYIQRSMLARSHMDPTVGYIYWKLGDRARAESEFRQVEERLDLRLAEGDEGWFPHMGLAVIRATRGQNGQALRAIEEGIAHGWRDAWSLSTYPPLESLRGEPRFQEILAGLRAEVARQRQRVEREGL
ncbi:MAG TPA: tetratricopeptide repeat protein [Longimicrobium sp.]|nr:tetratricopeptide repeat protein [Longimicrobium sp.]